MTSLCARLLTLLFVVLFAGASYAERLPLRALDQITAQAFKGTCDFTASEVTDHQRGLSKLIDVTLKATAAKKVEQAAWFSSCGMGTMYGWLAPYSKLAPAARETYIDQHATCSARPGVSDVTVTSCENFTNKMISQGFNAIGTAATYKKINTFLNANDRDGLALVFALRKLGWKTLYWNTDTGTAPPLPKDRSIVGVTPEDHTWDQKIALTKHIYHGVPIDGYLVNFSPNPGSATPRDDSVMNRLKAVPYFVGISHAGFHVWNGSYGVITESHSFWDPDDVRNIQTGAFLPPHASPTCREVGGTCWGYYSGIIAVPPGPWGWL